MLIKKITLSDFKNYAGMHSFDIAKINFINGRNGVGKSTLALHSILFALFGYNEVKLNDLITRGASDPNSFVEIELEYNNTSYIIKRSIPTNLEIKVNGVELVLANNTLKQEKIEELFGNVDFFKKFRMIDIKDSINILEQGNQALRKTLINFDDTIDMNAVRNAFLSRKNRQEQFNKDKALVFTHFPSTKRFQVLNVGFDNINKQITDIEINIKENEGIRYDISNRKSRAESRKSDLARQKNSIIANANCPTCSKALSSTKQKELLGSISSEIMRLNDEIARHIDDLSIQNEIVEQLKQTKKVSLDRKNRLTRYIERASARLKQKDYIYTNKDIELTKECISEIDGFSTFYTTEKLKRLEPLINNLVGKLGFSIRFEISDKNNLDIKLTQNKVEYQYKDLSSGQRLLVTVAFQLALLMEKNETGVIIADEGFSSLDSQNISLMFDIFKNSTFQLLAIVHRYEINDIGVNNICL